MTTRPIYLDNNATTPLDPDVLSSMIHCYESQYLNPASQHQLGRQARRVLESARDSIGRMLGAEIQTVEADQIILTSGGTESNNLALLGLVGDPPGKVLISPVEHQSVSGAADQLQRLGFDVCPLRVNRDGVIDLDHCSTAIDPTTRLVSVMLGNHETGVIQPVEQIAQLCSRHQIPMHTDAVQAVGKINVDFRRLGVTSLSCTAHKLHGPRGIGVLILKQGARLNPLLFGGFQQAGLRPGTESVALTVGMSCALERWQSAAQQRRRQMTQMRDRLEQQLVDQLPDIQINGKGASRLPHTSNISFFGLDRQALAMALDMRGVACSTGSACASGSSDPSPVLLAMGCSETLVHSALRFSVSSMNHPDEIDQAVSRIVLTVNHLRKAK